MEAAWREAVQAHPVAGVEDFAEQIPAEGIGLHGYIFERDNPFLEDLATYEEKIRNGQQSLQTGALGGAILWFEAAVQMDDTRADGWELLGLSRAENEQEVPAITALRESTRLQPDRASAHLALSVSFTNELQYIEAYDALEASLRTNPKYEHLPIPVLVNPLSMKEKQDAVQDLYIQAAQMNPDVLDPEVQIGLGVLFNISHEYDKAADCFRAALQSRPDDSYLWNKLGATLANGDQSAMAVDAYARALEIRPGYIRARYILGISCINLKSYRDAAEHFLGALSLQQLATEDSTRRNMSDTIWHSLRTTLLMANMAELAQHVSARSLEPFRAHFEF